MTPDDDADIRLRPTNTANATNIVGSNNGNLYLQTQAPSTAVYVKNQDYNDDVRLIVEGNVGIGAISPNSRLVVQGSGDSSSTSSLNITNSSGAPLLFVRDDGNVGIGTIGPNSRLAVQGSGTTSSTSSLNITDSSGAPLLFVSDDGGVGIGMVPAGGTKLSVNGNVKVKKIFLDHEDFIGISNLHEKITFDGVGDDIEIMNADVGIGTMDPQAKLDVNGDIRMSGYKIPVMRRGTVTVGANTISGVINYGVTFADIPLIMVYVQSSASPNHCGETNQCSTCGFGDDSFGPDNTVTYGYHLRNVATSSFRIHNEGGYQFTFKWVAVGELN